MYSALYIYIVFLKLEQVFGMHCLHICVGFAVGFGGVGTKFGIL